jgi:hypothetical protein
LTRLTRRDTLIVDVISGLSPAQSPAPFAADCQAIADWTARRQDPGM